MVRPMTESLPGHLLMSALRRPQESTRPVRLEWQDPQCGTSNRYATSAFLHQRISPPAHFSTSAFLHQRISDVSAESDVATQPINAETWTR